MSQFVPAAMREELLEPIYEAIDRRDYKQASKLAGNVKLQSQCGPIVAALKAFVLTKLGKPAEALGVINSITDPTQVCTDKTRSEGLDKPKAALPALVGAMPL